VLTVWTKCLAEEGWAANVGRDSPPDSPQEFSPYTIPLNTRPCGRVFEDGLVDRLPVHEPSLVPVRFEGFPQVSTGKISFWATYFPVWMPISKVEGPFSKTSGHARHRDQKLV